MLFSALEHGFPWADLGFGARAAHLNVLGHSAAYSASRLCFQAFLGVHAIVVGREAHAVALKRVWTTVFFCTFLWFHLATGSEVGNHVLL